MLKYRKFILVLTVLVIVASLSAIVDIRKLEDPVLNLPFYSVVVFAPGTTSDYIEKAIIEDLEDGLEEIEDIVESRTIINDNFLTVRLEAESSVDVDAKLDDIKGVVNGIDFPSAVKDVDISKVNPLDVNVVQVALFSTEGTFDYRLNDIAEDLKDAIGAVNGINKVTIRGDRKQFVNVKLDLDRLNLRKIPIELVLGKMKERLTILPSGKLQSDTYDLSVITPHGFLNLEDISNTILLSKGGEVVRVRDVADVSIEEDMDSRYYTRYNNHLGIFVSANAKKSAILSNISRDVDEIIDNFSSKYKGTIQVEKIFDQFDSVDSKLEELRLNLIQGIGLVTFLIFIVLGLRNSFIASIIIPISILSAVWLLYLAGFALQQVSIAGLIISIGLVVDDNIVIIENIHRLIAEGHSKMEAITEGVKSIMWPVINSSVTTGLVFLPMTQLGGRTGEYIKTLPITVIFCLIASLVFSLILTPVLSGFILKDEKGHGWLGVYMYKLADKYTKLLGQLIKHPFFFSISLLLVIVASIVVFKKVGVTLFPPADKAILLVDIEMPKGSAFDVTQEAADEITMAILKDEDVKYCAVNVGHGNPKLYYNIFPKGFNSDYAQVVVFYKKWNKDFGEHVAVLEDQLKRISSARIKVKQFMNGPPINAPVEIKLLSNSRKNLEASASKVLTLLEKDKEITSIKSPFDELEFVYDLEIDEEKIGDWGLNSLEVRRGILIMLSGLELEDVTIKEKEYALKVSCGELGGKMQYTDILEKLKVRSRISGEYIPFHNFGKLKLKKQASNIEYFNEKNAFTIEADVKGGINVLNKTNELMESIGQLSLSPDIEIEYGGEYKTSRKSFGGLIGKILVGILAIYSVLVLQFRSYLQPIVVLLAIPLAFIGSIFILYLFNQTFSFLAFIGFTSITGVVINNSMLLVDTYNGLMKNLEMSSLEAVIESGKRRFAPILITSITTIMGLLPMIYSGSSLWQPLALTIVGGMLSSSFLVLLMIPWILNILYKNE